MNWDLGELIGSMVCLAVFSVVYSVDVTTNENCRNLLSEPVSLPKQFLNNMLNSRFGMCFFV